jgi:hypothetical protein
MQALVDIDVKAKKGSCPLCHLANGMRCDVKETVHGISYWEIFHGIFISIYLKAARFP